MALKKRIAVEELAEGFRLFHAKAFNEQSLLESAEKSGLSLDGQYAQQNAVREWRTFGLFVVSQGVSAACKGNEELRNRILDAFFVCFYAGMAQAGTKRSDFPSIEREFRMRFHDYYSALNNPGPPGPSWHLGKTVSMNLFGETIPHPSLLVFGLSVNAALIAGVKTIRGIVERYEIV
jgi:hypothetical protein